MRLRQRDLVDIYLKRKIPATDGEGTEYSTYDPVPIKIKAKIQPAGGKAMAEMYGERLKYMRTMRYDGQLNLNEGDGLCIYVSPDNSPDYKITAINPWDIKVFDLEKVI